ncbi:CIC11C00000000033 [Sungouiella intermedia]|uniref:CIC11C00000000033 n=1 Tax=Sungouiella intermedia TaxID=45354 RepID=A0A1L0GGZ4_9ASCO|nr:CIC11C00000000033 [[Candida] intermedia]
MGKSYAQYGSPNARGSTRSTQQPRNEMSMLRRVWVKRKGGNPTTIMIGPEEIIDDLKSAICVKFPNSVGKLYDPADIQVLSRMHPQEKLQSRRVKQTKLAIGRIKADLADESQPKLSLSNLHQHFYVALEPDQVIWEILDDQFSGAMSMSDAFLIDAEAKVAPDISSDNDRSLHREDFDHSSSSTHDRPQSPTHPWLSLNRLSPLSTNNHSFHLKPHQPIPMRQNSFGKYRSVSPSFQGSQSPPLQFPNQHKRSLSNPPQSPVPSFNQQSRNGNPQAVLLLPKNFSLGEQNAIKRFPVDSNSVEKGYSELAPKMDNGSNVSNIGSETNTPSNSSYGKAQDGQSIPRSLPERQSYSTILKDSEGSQSVNMNSGSSTTRSSQDLAKKDSGDSSAKMSTKANSNSKETTINTSTFEKVLPLISVLVVEDNSINQAILGAFLRKHKIHYEIAKNGQEAVDKWRKGGFHLVLMDIQLPVKSGIEATKEIRHLEKVNKIGVFAQHELGGSNYSGHLQLKEDEKLNLNIFRSPVIIVALTASSNSSVDKKNALTAGCNDFLTKPVNLVWLQNKITEWGCMQALIDFDAWRVKGSPQSTTSKSKANGEGKSRSNVNPNKGEAILHQGA